MGWGEPLFSIFRYIFGKPVVSPPNLNLIREQAEYVGIPKAASDSLFEIAALVGNNPELSSLYNGLLNLSSMKNYHTQIGGAMTALILFGALPETRTRHIAMGIPEHITKSTFYDIKIALDTHASAHNGAFGISCFKWLTLQTNPLKFPVGPYLM